MEKAKKMEDKVVKKIGHFRKAAVLMANERFTAAQQKIKKAMKIVRKERIQNQEEIERQQTWWQQRLKFKNAELIK